MLKLALEIGALDPDDRLFGIPEEIDQRYQSLNKTHENTLLAFAVAMDTNHSKNLL